MDPFRISEEHDAETISHLRFRKQIAIAMLAVLVYEYLVTIREELRHIWRVNLYLVVSGPLSKLVTSEKICSTWFAFLITSGTCLLLALDFILMLRIYALYCKSRRVGLFLVFLFLVMLTTAAILGPMCIYSIPYSSMCEVLVMHPVFPYYGGAQCAVHVCLGLLTAAKWNLNVLRIPVVKLATRDGGWVLAVITLLVGCLISYDVAIQKASAEINFMCPISVFSIACCRLVMNMQTLDFHEGDDESISGFTTNTELIVLEQLDRTNVNS